MDWTDRYTGILNSMCETFWNTRNHYSKKGTVGTNLDKYYMDSFWKRISNVCENYL